MTTISSARAERFGDTPVAFNFRRYQPSTGDGEAKWFFSVSRYISHGLLIEAEMTAADLRKMARFCEKAAEAVESDGGRKVKEPAL